MKICNIFLSFAFLSAVLFGCQKESPVSDNPTGTSQGYVKTVIQFSIGEQNYTLSSVRQETLYEANNNCAGYGCGNNIAKDYSDDWATYAAGHLLSVIRQDDAGNPAFRLSLSGNIDLSSGTFPAKVDNARMTLHDFKGALIQPNDDPAYSTGTLTFEGGPDAVDLVVTSRNGNVVQGTFGGVLKMTSGSALEIRDGTFTAQLRGL